MIFFKAFSINSNILALALDLILETLNLVYRFIFSGTVTSSMKQYYKLAGKSRREDSFHVAFGQKLTNMNNIMRSIFGKLFYYYSGKRLIMPL